MAKKKHTLRGWNIRFQTELYTFVTFLTLEYQIINVMDALHNIPLDWRSEYALIFEDELYTRIYGISQGCCKSSWAVARSFGSRRKHLVIRSVTPAMSSGFNIHPVSWIHFSNGLRTKRSNFLGRPDHKVLISKIKTSVNRIATHNPAENNLCFESNAEENLPWRIPHKKWSFEKAIHRLPTHHVQRIPLV